MLQVRPPGRWILGLFWGIALAALAGAAQAVMIPLTVELDTGAVEEWGTVDVQLGL